MACEFDVSGSDYVLSSASSTREGEDKLGYRPFVNDLISTGQDRGVIFFPGWVYLRIHFQDLLEWVLSTGYMSPYQSKGDRSDAQLRKAGRASDTVLGKPGGFSPIASKGGGPSPSGSVPSVAAVLPQPALTVTPVPRISASAAATNRG